MNKKWPQTSSRFQIRQKVKNYSRYISMRKIFHYLSRRKDRGASKS